MIHSCPCLAGPRQRWVCVLLAVALLWVAHSGDAQGVQPPPAQPAERGTATHSAEGTGYRISGTVVNARTGAKLARCTVQITSTNDGFADGTGWTASGVTEEDGAFFFNGLRAGKYQLTAARRGFIAESYQQHFEYSTAIAVGPKLSPGELRFELMPEAILSGTVTDEVGEPVRHAQVQLFADEDREGVHTTRQQKGTLTDDRGAYEIAELAPGTYFLEVSAQPWYAQHLNGMGGSATQNPALNVAYPTLFYPDATDADAATPIPVKGGEHLQANFSLTPQPAMRIRIPVPVVERGGYSVSVSQRIFGVQENQARQFQTRTPGFVEVDGVLPGHYDVSITQYGLGPQDGRAEVGARAQVNVKEMSADVVSGSTELQDTQTTDEVVVTGKVSSPQGKLPEHATIILTTPHTQRAQFGAALDGTGEFTVRVPAGRYEVLGAIQGMYLAGVSAKGAKVTGRVLEAKAGSTPRLEIVAGSGFGQVNGLVQRGDGGASGVMVVLAPEDAANNEVLFRRDQSDSDGTFTLRNILPGNYRLLAIDRGWELEWAKPGVLAPFLAKSTKVVVRAQDRLTATVEAQER